MLNLLDNRVVNFETLVWRQGFPAWVPLSSVHGELMRAKNPSAQVEGSPGYAQSARCVECGKFYPLSELAEIKAMHVCAACKPVFLEKLGRGTPVGGVAGLWRNGGQLVIAKEAPLPDRCVKCNASAPGARLKRSLYWHHPALYLMILFPGLIFYAIVAVFVRKTATIHIGLCEEHRRKRRNAILIACSLLLGGVVVLILGIAATLDATKHSESGGWIVFAGVALIMSALFFAVFACRLVYPKKISDTHSFVAGVCEKYLALLPDWVER